LTLSVIYRGSDTLLTGGAAAVATLPFLRVASELPSNISASIVDQLLVGSGVAASMQIDSGAETSTVASTFPWSIESCQRYSLQLQSQPMQIDAAETFNSFQFPDLHLRVGCTSIRCLGRIEYQYRPYS
jgi:hypothetical protein